LPFRWKGFSQTTRYTYIINYDNSTNLWNNLDELRKRTITRALNNGIRIEVSDDFDLVYKFVSLSYERQGLSLGIPYDDWKKLDDISREKSKRLILRAVDRNNYVHAVIYIVFNQKSAYYVLSGSDPALRKQGGHTLVLWEAVKYFTDKVQFFNFGGSDIERIENHIKGYGGTLTPYFHIYNENQMGCSISLKHHVKRIYFHLGAIFKIAGTRLTGQFSRK
jgi:lipid II:glycine glycyltransferase (peptidoglycan interpeptide bridge formation enzyme)